MATYEVDVTIELDVEGDPEEALTVTDVVMQRAWDTDQGRRWVDQKWHYSISGVGAVTKIVEEDASL